MHSMEYNDWVLSVPEILERFHARASPASDWWLKFAFHYTDVRNAANIIETGHLYSRNKALEDDSMTNDNANPDVIAQSSDSHDWVRLYFRPKTPTQYRNEDIKPASTQGDGHCPVPVFFFLTWRACFSSMTHAFPAEASTRKGKHQISTLIRIDFWVTMFLPEKYTIMVPTQLTKMI